MSRQPARIRLITLAMLGAAACSGAQGPPDAVLPPAPVIAPAREQLLASPPAGWQQIGATSLPTLRRAEFVPAEESADSWTSHITFEAMLEQPLPDPIEFVDLLAEDRQRACGTFERLPTFSGEENGYPTTVDLLVCHRDRDSERSEVMLMKTIRGNDAFYIVTRGRRGPPIPKGGKADVAEEEVGAWALYLRTVGVCDDRRAEHPCPSATDATSRSE